MEIVEASIEQVELLTRISKAAFETDITVGGKDVGGPPNYDSVEWHNSMQERRALYAIMLDEEIIGGLLVFIDSKNKDSMFMGRIFIDPKHHRKGFGIAAIREIEKKWNRIKCWKLDTPIWNTRTKPFYEKNGYAERYRDDESIYFQKILE
jgi:predicted acetyltransferase